MKAIYPVAWLPLLAACAGTPEVPSDVQAVRDYVDVGELEQTDRIRTHGSDKWSPLTDRYVLYKGRDGWYLLAFNRKCHELTDNTRITPDRRYDHNLMRRGIDTLRGCRIDNMYPLTQAQALEIEALVKTADGFDDTGSTFDGDGVMRNWWTEEDRTEFDRRTAALVEQYNSYAPFEDLSVNGEFTLGENIGDLGGIGIGLLAYKMSLDGEEPPVIDGFTGVQRVFLGYGQIWRHKYRNEALRQQIMTDPHSPSKYRANGAVRNVPEFYEAFDVTQEHGLYLPPEERVKIW